MADGAVGATVTVRQISGSGKGVGIMTPVAHVGEPQSGVHVSIGGIMTRT